ncbi:VanZ family protein [Nocardioides sp.]|uniref:VanZ family protein n=1 Tax=Nocardioides sp. TaxID=35761 RepID=UPI00286CD399|nr:VanZ family protein [Nocardioides sp.]
MSDQTSNALLAIALGTVVAIVLLVPVAAYQYRLDGRLQPSDLAILLSGAVYGLALWTYTLLPVPPEGTYRCKGRQLDPLGSIGTIDLGPPGALLRDPAFLQVALNVLLFVPLGYYVRQILKRGVVVATLLGLGTSLLIEVTQLTGVWSVYDCAYRLFDVDDLIVNTLGALGGSLLSAVVVRRRVAAVPLPTSITWGRRLVGMLSDVLFLVLAGAAAALAYRAWCLYGPGTFDADVQALLQVGVPGAVEVLSVLLVGRTVGEHVISVRAVARRPRLVVLSRLVKLATGVGPLLVLTQLGTTVAATALPAYALLTVVASWRSEGHRGLSHQLAGMDLVIAREEAFGAVDDGRDQEQGRVEP